MEIQEIDHFLMQDSIDQISYRTTQDQGQSGANLPPLGGGLVKNDKDRQNRNSGNNNERQDFVFGVLFREQPKSDSGVAYVGEAEKIVDNLYRIIQGNMGADKELGVLIDNDQRI